VKILFYGLNFKPELTGVGKYSGEMVNWLANHNHQIRVITSPPYYPQWRVSNGYTAFKYQKENWQEGNHSSLKIWRTPIWVPKKPSGLKRIIHLFSFAISSFPVVISQIRWRPELVIAIEPTLAIAPAALLLAGLSGSKVWLHIQDFEVDAAFNMEILHSNIIRRMAFAIERFLMKRFDRVSTISKRMLERLNTKGIEPVQQVFFPNWVDIDAIHPLKNKSCFRTELKLPDNKIVALYAGNLGEKQGLEILIEAAKQTVEDRQLLWVIAGEGSIKQQLQALSDGLLNVIWLPIQPLERLNDLLNLADIHLLPQRADAADLVMPSKLTGMLASGRPVVATAEIGTQVAEVVEECGIVVPPGDVKLLIEAVQNLAKDIDRRHKLGMIARHYAELHLSKNTIMTNFESEAVALISGND